MSSSTNNDVESGVLAVRYLDGSATPEEVERLDALLVADPASCEWFASLCIVVTGLGEVSASPSQPQGDVESSETHVPPSVNISSLLGNAYHGTMGFFSQELPLSLLIAAVVMGAAMLGAWAYKTSHYQPIAKTSSPSLPVDARPEVVFVGRITGMVDVKWSDDKDFLPPLGYAYVPLGRKYKLVSGLMQITYDTGAKVILQGPCTYEVESRASGYLSLGKLTARIEERREKREERTQTADSMSSLIPHPSSFIPHPSSLFVIRTPIAVVTDLGTEFGVEVMPRQETEVHVFRGSVRVQALSGDLKDDVVLRVNESVRVEKAGVEGRSLITHLDAAETSTFAQEMPHPQTAYDSRAYAELVLSLNPAAYYRMEQPSGTQDRRVVVDSAPGGHHGELRLGDEYGGSPYRSGRFGSALWLRGPEVNDHVIVSDYKKAENDRLTVAVWVMATGRPGWAMIVANWGTPRPGRKDTDNAGQFHISLYRTDGDLCAIVMQRNGEWAPVREGADHLFPIDVWQHVALTVDEAYARLYRNGKEVASARCEGVMPRPQVDALGIGCKLDETGTDTSPYIHYWQGRIDELAIFNEALSAETILRLYEAKQPSEKNLNSDTDRE